MTDTENQTENQTEKTTAPQAQPLVQAQPDQWGGVGVQLILNGISASTSLENIYQSFKFRLAQEK